METIHIYLNFNGNCEEAFNFYKTVIGGEFNYIGRFGEMPESEGITVPEADKNKIMHVSLPMGNSILMGSDTGGEWAPTFVQGNNFSISIAAESKQEAEKLFNSLAKGGKITMPLTKTFWSELYGMLTDKFGVSWMVSFDEKKDS